MQTDNIKTKDQRREERNRYGDDLSRLQDALRNHRWAHKADSFKTYIEATKTETELFARAMNLGVHGLTAFRAAQQGEIHDLIIEAESKMFEKMEARVRETREKYARPIDLYKDRLVQHDWQHDYSDDGGVSRRGRESEKKLILEAHGRPEGERAEWIAAFVEAWKQYKGALLNFDERLQCVLGR
jgi:hypothetical protein